MITLTEILNELALFRDGVDMGKQPDRYDLLRFIDELEIGLNDVAHKHEDNMSDMVDELRLAMGWQDEYLSQLDHAERHIEWLENEFADDIVDVDKYERAC